MNDNVGTKVGADSPDGLWLFDGICNLCSGSVRFVLAVDRRGAVRFTPIQSAYGRMLAKRAGIDPDRPLTFLFFEHGRALGKSAAVLALLARLPSPWRWLGVVRWIPERWRDRAYDWVAAHRYRLLGRRRACMAPAPLHLPRFVLEPPGA